MIFPSRQPQNPMNRPMYGIRQQRPSAGTSAGRNAAKPTGAGALSSITKSFGGKGIDSISKTLDGVQQVLNMVQSTAPLIQEYGPMVKNLPAMYRMAKAFKDIQSEDGETQASDDIANSGETDKSPVQVKPVAANVAKAVQPEQKGPSKPKLYV